MPKEHICPGCIAPISMGAEAHVERRTLYAGYRPDVDYIHVRCYRVFLANRDDPHAPAGTADHITLSCPRCGHAFPAKEVEAHMQEITEHLGHCPMSA